MKKIICIGGSSIDYIATTFNKLERGVSNNGSLAVNFGGVAHNICWNLALLGHKMTFITAYNKNDTTGHLIKKHLDEYKITNYAPDTKLPSCSYVAINGNDHDLAVAIFDNRIVTNITPKYIDKMHSIINKFDYIVLCANLSQKTIDHIVNKYYKKKKIFCDAISPYLVQRFTHVLDKIYLMKCNIFEARSLVKNGEKLEGEKLIKELFKVGLHNVIVSYAGNDIYYGLNQKDIYCFPIKAHTKFVNTTGCGDALTSGVIDQLSRGKSFAHAIKFGHQLSNLVLMCDGAVNPEIKKYANK